MFHRRKNSQKPRGDLIDRFRQTFGGIIRPRRRHPTQPSSQDDIHLPGRSSHISPNLDLGGVSGLEFSSTWRDSGLVPLGLLASQHPGCSTPQSSGIGAILHNQAGNLHSPSLDLKMTPFSPINAVPNIQPDLNQFGTQFIAPEKVQMIPDIQRPMYAPTEFAHQDLNHGAMDKLEVYQTFDPFLSESASNPAALTEASSPRAILHSQSHTQGEKLRYHVTLRNPTTMVKSVEEVPISYLNKGQVYDIMVMDLNPPLIPLEVFRYRTYIRISFDGVEQRSNPALYWQLWKEGRGITEAQQREGELFAVEFNGEDRNCRHIQLEQESIDGFCVTWNVERTESTKGRTIPLRFNFLSTDFTHSKGVKGIPVRLCAKTELLSLESAGNPGEAEVCFCKVKLFRDHGAERKVANDLKLVRKSIRKLEQQIKDVKLGGRIGKRRHANTKTDMTDSKNLNHGLIRSGFRDGSIEDDLRRKLAISKSMLSSTRTDSVLALLGDKEDDPDQYPVDLARGQESANCVRDARIEGCTAEQPLKPIACFFIRPSNEENDVFRAIYLSERTAEDLKRKICEKYHAELSKIVRLVRIINDELKVIIDEDLVRKLPEGQTMIVDICETTSVVDRDSCLKEIRLKY